MDKELYNKLIFLKENLKKNFASNGKAPIICSDEIIAKIAENPPKRKSDFFAIEGVGKTFVDRYADYFLLVINDYMQSNKSIFDSDIKETLLNLENRLINLSQGNKNLYIGRLYSKLGVDVYSENIVRNEDFLKIVKGKKTSIKILANDEDDESSSKLYKKIGLLNREIIRQEMETGENCLYLAYPFVVGYYKTENFKINAPIMLFPVKCTKTNDKISISKDESRDVLYNTTLLLLKNKIDGKNDAILPSAFVENVDGDKLIENAVKFYNDNGFSINYDGADENLTKFVEFTDNSFPKKSKTFDLSFNIVLARFSLCDNEIQRDYKKMINEEIVNQQVDSLISEVDGVDLFADSLERIVETEFDENKIFYINELNKSQEDALAGVNSSNAFVIQGPPGTGKSQTITSIIADCICNDKNVLVVSQKKVALEVIYSRLGELSKYSIMLADGKDKKNFYNQLQNILTADDKAILYSQKIKIINEKIKQIELTLDQISEKIKIENSNIFNIYGENIHNYFLNNTEKVLECSRCVDESLNCCDYETTKELKNFFENEKELKKLNKFIDLKEKYFWIQNVRKNLTINEKAEISNKVDNFCKNCQELDKINKINKIIKKCKLKKELKNILKDYFINDKNFNYLFKNSTEFKEGISTFDEYIKVEFEFSKLNDVQKKYFNTLMNFRNLLNIKLSESNLILYDYLVYCKIGNFESKNVELFSNIENFSEIFNNFSSLLDEKIAYVKKHCLGKLVDQANKMKASKRFMEIQRLAENKNKRDVKKFIDKFSYELFKGVRVWLLTPETVSEILPFEGVLFDQVIFDEASQIYIERSLPAIARGKNVVVCGDHKQLRPSSFGVGRLEFADESEDDDIETKSALDEESLLDLARFRYPSVMLNYHYRAKYQELIEFSNRYFYDGKINISPNSDSFEKPPIEVVKVDGLWENRTNKKEAQKVVELVKNILSTRVNNETIGIVTFNVSQQDYIQDLLEKECENDSTFANLYKKELSRKNGEENVGIFVKNIENVQGDERDIIIFSLAYAKNSDGKIVHNYGWLNQRGGENRLNVAISRAKRKIFIVASLNPNQLDVDGLKNDGPKLFKKYLEYAFAVSSQQGEVVKSILKSNNGAKTETNFEKGKVKQDLQDRLTAHGLLVESDIGIGNYHVDLAIKDKKTNKFVCIVDFSDFLYNNIGGSRERDFHRQKFMETRGFRVFRLWINEYYHNPESVVVKILNLLNEKIC